MNAEQILKRLRDHVEDGTRVMATSSFQTQSLPLLHLIGRLDAEIPVVFLDTGYHFPETLEFRDQVAQRMGLRLINLRSRIPRSQQRDAAGNLYFTSDPDYCCYMNKVQPLEELLAKFDVWVSGVRRDQSAVRQGMATEEPGPGGILRFHPMLDWRQEDIERYLVQHDLPRHPLEGRGYGAIGCDPCTRRDAARHGRWFGLTKTECGLHTELRQAKESG